MYVAHRPKKGFFRYEKGSTKHYSLTPFITSARPKTGPFAAPQKPYAHLVHLQTETPVHITQFAYHLHQENQMRLPYIGAQRTETPPRPRIDNRRRKRPARAALSLLAAGAILFGGDLPAVLAQAPSDEAILAAAQARQPPHPHTQRRSTPHHPHRGGTRHAPPAELRPIHRHLHQRSQAAQNATRRRVGCSPRRC